MSVLLISRFWDISFKWIMNGNHNKFILKWNSHKTSGDFSQFHYLLLVVALCPVLQWSHTHAHTHIHTIPPHSVSVPKIGSLLISMDDAFEQFTENYIIQWQTLHEWLNVNLHSTIVSSLSIADDRNDRISFEVFTHFTWAHCLCGNKSKNFARFTVTNAVATILIRIIIIIITRRLAIWAVNIPSGALTCIHNSQLTIQPSMR